MKDNFIKGFLYKEIYRNEIIDCYYLLEKVVK